MQNKRTSAMHQAEFDVGNPDGKEHQAYYGIHPVLSSMYLFAKGRNIKNVKLKNQNLHSLTNKPTGWCWAESTDQATLEWGVWWSCPPNSALASTWLPTSPSKTYAFAYTQAQIICWPTKLYGWSTNHFWAPTRKVLCYTVAKMHIKNDNDKGKSSPRRGDMKSKLGHCCLAGTLRLIRTTLINWGREDQC